jgi:hypothetical protein
LIAGLEANMDSGLSITGGMCGDDARFEKTLASYKAKRGEVVLIGFYGSTLEVSYASLVVGFHLAQSASSLSHQQIFYMKLMVNRR